MTPEELTDAQAHDIENLQRLVRSYRRLAIDVTEVLGAIAMKNLSNRMMALDLSAHSALEQIGCWDVMTPEEVHAAKGEVIDG